MCLASRLVNWLVIPALENQLNAHYTFIADCCVREGVTRPCARVCDLTTERETEEDDMELRCNDDMPQNTEVCHRYSRVICWFFRIFFCGSFGMYVKELM